MAAQTPDDLPVYKCGLWTIEKLFFLCQYLAQTTQAMVGNPRFESINYVDLFCGSGVCEVDDGTRVRRYPGSALLAASCTKPFSRLILADSQFTNVLAVRKRIAALNVPSEVITTVGDANTEISSIIAQIPDRSLTVAFLDPYSLDIAFDTVKTLAKERPLDLLILFADAMDIVRNVEEYYYPGRSNKLDVFLGKRDWRRDWDNLKNRNGANTREMFANIYLQQLEAIGYEHTRTRAIRGDSGPLYRLIYACKNPLGLKFWDIAASEDLHGNKSLFRI